MGFLFNLFFAFILIPLTGILLIIWLISRKKIFGQIVGFIWLGIVGLFLLVGILHFFTDKKVLDKSDYYGQYIIDRSYFPGKQADYQYNTFRFEIRENDSIYFYVTDKEKIISTYKGSITTNDNYISERLSVFMQMPTHHIMMSHPTTYRSTWSFILVFYFKEFNNVFFKKGKWKLID